MRPAPEPAPRTAPWKLWLRLGVSVVLLAILVSNVPDLDGIIPARDHVRTTSLLVAAFVATLTGVVLSAWRWQRVLLAYDEPVGLGRLTSHYLAGLFVGNVLPSTIGGDVLRVARAGRTTGSTERAFASVVLERLTGFVALPVLVFVGFAVRPSLASNDHAWVALLVAGITLAVLAVVLVLAGHPRLAGRFGEHESWTRFIASVHVGVDRLRREPRATIGILGTALVYQVSVVVSVVLIAEALSLGIPTAALVAFVPAVAMVQVLPLSINGLGVREGMLVLLLGPLGVSNGQAIAVGLLWYAAVLGTSMLGAPAFAVGHRGGRTVAVELDEAQQVIDEIDTIDAIDTWDAIDGLDDRPSSARGEECPSGERP